MSTLVIFAGPVILVGYCAILGLIVYLIYQAREALHKPKTKEYTTRYDRGVE